MRPLKAIALALLLSAAALAHADSIGVHIGSDHFRDGPNNTNPGAYYRWESGWEAGAYYNSHRTFSAYVGHQFDVWRRGPLTVGYMVGGVTGYPKYGPAAPFAVAQARYSIGAGWSAELWVLPHLSSPPLVHLSVERRF